MNRHKSKKIIIMFLIIMIVVIATTFGYLFWQSKFYKLECSRVNNEVEESIYFEFNIFRNINRNNITQINSFPYNSKKSAEQEYEIGKSQGYDVKLNGKNVDYYFENIKLDIEIPNKIKKVKKVYEDLKYTCKMVKK